MKIKVEEPSEEKLKELGIKSWAVWEKEASEFDWHYDEQEVCYLLKGEVEVTTEDGEQVEFGAGDLVTFPAGLDCVWKIKEDVKKHYKLG
ncbi:cupin domain-containing protein [Halanaerobacter jeridensis]|uniref:Cupin superfamily protein n=1 Tax=Halanaerobacter jeridensis TaxID=706427 RepID=A0A939BPD2_9FIRM|nr:cupin domain-containing protein [Halanaerobacter jeridensis]MBM7556673.1 putative cupin superfamily protein [Halanaerobacter jeridensis]